MSANKRQKTTHKESASTTTTKSTKPTKSTTTTVDLAAQFADGLLDHNTISQLHKEYIYNDPFKFAVVEKLFQDDLLQKVKDECLSELNFSTKETDIYKVNQTGDLASLNYLTADQISLLPNLLTLRDALYSPQFRQFLQAVTGCGPLSGKKQDMSVNSYTSGCHLLNHDDVIGTRRVSYILYMPLPHYTMWQKEWGGALELYPVRQGDSGEPEPEPIPSKSIPPSWNQFIFFEVQPGKSFHSVEEVVVGGKGEDGRERLSISGWFHAAQEGEEGYVPTAVTETKSSREQLTSTSTTFTPYPVEDSSPSLPGEPLSKGDIAFLSEFLNPVYLQPRTMETLAERFVEESSLELHSFLCNALAESLQSRLRDLDTLEGLGSDRAGFIPPHTSGTQNSWEVKGPPHKWRYCILSNDKTPAEVVRPRHAGSADEIMRSLQNELFPSPAFRQWVAIVTRLLPLGYSAEARRFRPGLDYTLATSDEQEARLDAVLGLTPAVENKSSTSSRRRNQQQGLDRIKGWSDPEWGGWECYMAPHNEEDDPAIYRSSSKKSNGTNGHAPDPENDENPKEDEEAMDEDEAEEESTLLTVQPGFNRLLLVLRDERVMRFVKYVSAAAEGSRWDVCGEYAVGMVSEEEGEGSDVGSERSGVSGTSSSRR